MKIFTDGGARGNPGPAAAGFVVKDETGKILVQKGDYLGETTNNVAEYQAVIKALEWLKTNRRVIAERKRIDLFLDSQLIVNQLNGLFKIKNAGLRNLIVEARQLEREINLPIYYQHIPRGKNREADFLVNQVLTDRLRS